MGQLQTLGFIALGGAVGACSRYLISEWCAYLLGRNFPYGTLGVNVIGSLLMGILVASLANGSITTEPWRQIIGLGFLGALTTFSTFSMDNVTLMEQGEHLKLLLNIALNVVLSFLAATAGYWCLIKQS